MCDLSYRLPFVNRKGRLTFILNGQGRGNGWTHNPDHEFIPYKIFSKLYICLTSVTRVKCGVRSTLCWKVGNISGST